jgi:hypothetical protein
LAQTIGTDDWRYQVNVLLANNANGADASSPTFLLLVLAVMVAQIVVALSVQAHFCEDVFCVVAGWQVIVLRGAAHRRR